MFGFLKLRRKKEINNEFFKAGLCIKTIKRNEINNKQILFSEGFLDEITILFEDRIAIKFETIKGRIFEKKYITIFEINELLYKAKQISKKEFEKQKNEYEYKWNNIYKKLIEKKKI